MPLPWSQPRSLLQLLLAAGPLLLVLSALLLPEQAAHAAPNRVAIIGAGIGGAYAAHSLALLSPDLRIDVFEAAPTVGGRAHSFEFQGTTLELGASIIWDKNLHLYRAAQRLGLGIKLLSEAPEEVAGFAVFDGQRFVLNQTGTVWSMAKMALRYGPSPLLYSRHVLQVWEHSFKQIYDMQDDEQQRSFTDPEDMLRALGLLNFTQQTCSQHMKDYLRSYWWSWGARAFANDLAGAINRCNYNQMNEQMNALAGLISFMPAAAPGLWAVEGGNWRLSEALLNASNATLHLQQAVRLISQEPEGQFVLSTSGGEGGQPGDLNGPYDAVIIATPLESANLTFSPRPRRPAPGSAAGADADAEPAVAAGGAHLLPDPAGHVQQLQPTAPPQACRWMRCSEGGGGGAGEPAAPAAQGEGSEGGAGAARKLGLGRTFQQTVTTYVSGELQASYFGVQQLPSQRIFSSDDARLPFSAIGPKLIDGRLIYKVFSSVALEPGVLGQLFGQGYQVLAARVWDAYPRFSPPEAFAPFQLGPGLCYVNALENAASAMELSAIGARNCALVARGHLRRREQACSAAAVAAAEAEAEAVQ